MFLFDKLHPLIVDCRRKNNLPTSFELFDKLVKENIERICYTWNTRWLVSICDTYADYGTPIEQSNALIISTLVNMEKLASTYLYTQDCSVNEQHLKTVMEDVAELWDGVYTYNVIRGDMTNNLFSRMEKVMEDTPILKHILDTIKQRLEVNDTILSRLNKHRKTLFDIGDIQ